MVMSTGSWIEPHWQKRNGLWWIVFRKYKELRKAYSPTTSSWDFTSTESRLWRLHIVRAEIFNNETWKIAGKGVSSNLNLAWSEHRVSISLNEKISPTRQKWLFIECLYTFSSSLIPLPSHRLISHCLIVSIYLAASSPVLSVFPLSADFHVRRNCYFWFGRLVGKVEKFPFIPVLYTKRTEKRWRCQSSRMDSNVRRGVNADNTYKINFRVSKISSSNRNLLNSYRDTFGKKKGKRRKIIPMATLNFTRYCFSPVEKYRLCTDVESFPPR